MIYLHNKPHPPDSQRRSICNHKLSCQTCCSQVCWQAASAPRLEKIWTTKVWVICAVYLIMYPYNISKKIPILLFLCAFSAHRCLDVSKKSQTHIWYDVWVISLVPKSAKAPKAVFADLFWPVKPVWMWSLTLWHSNILLTLVLARLLRLPLTDTLHQNICCGYACRLDQFSTKRCHRASLVYRLSWVLENSQRSGPQKVHF